MKKQRNRFVNNSSGITLIALVITVIVLLILVGVSISALIGNNGIVSQASDSVRETRIGIVKEEITLAWTSCYNEYYIDGINNFNKQKADYFTKENLQKYLETKGIVLNVAYNPEGASKVVYKSNMDELVYRLKIGDNTNAILIREPDTDEIIRLADKITSYNYGDTVSNYIMSANGVSVKDWKVFYAGDKNVFLISSDYLPNDTVNLEKTEMTKLVGYTRNIYWENNKPSSYQEISESILKLFRAGVVDGYDLNSNKDNANAKCVSVLLNTENWSQFKDINGYGEFAIGSPTLEMWISSWNEKYNDTLAWGKGDNGYKIGINESTLGSTIGSDGINVKKGYKEADLASDNALSINERNLYYPYTNSQYECQGYWLASPGAESEENQNLVHVQHVNYNGAIGSYYFNYQSYALRPVISLYDTILGTQNEVDGSWELGK